MASGRPGKRQTAWISSAVQISMPGITSTPYSAPAAMAASQFLQELWSVTAITSSPFTAAIPAMLAGVISPSPQGDRQEWICRS